MPGIRVAAQLSASGDRGLPERFPRLKDLFIEGGFGWIPSTTWRMDQAPSLRRFRGEVRILEAPAVRNYSATFLGFTTQPIDEPTMQSRGSVMIGRR